MLQRPLPGYSPYGQRGLKPPYVYDVIFRKGELRVILQRPFAGAEKRHKKTPPFGGV